MQITPKGGKIIENTIVDDHIFVTVQEKSTSSYLDAKLMGL